MSERPVANATMKCNLSLEDLKGKVEKLSTVEDVLPGQSFEEFTHGHEVELIWAVEDHTLNSHGFSQILGGLSFTCPGRSCRCPSKFEMESTCQCQVTPVKINTE